MIVRYINVHLIIIIIIIIPDSLKTCQPTKCSGAISICPLVTSPNKAGGVAQAVPVPDRSTRDNNTDFTGYLI